jgi:hypothetical protein
MRDQYEVDSDNDNCAALLLAGRRVRKIVDHSRSCRDTVGVYHKGLARTTQ